MRPRSFFCFSTRVLYLKATLNVETSPKPNRVHAHVLTKPKPTQSSKQSPKQVQFQQVLHKFEVAYEAELITSPVTDYYWFPDVDRQQTEALFASNGLQPGTFLIRFPSSGPQGTFALSTVCADESIRHFRIIFSQSPYKNG